MFQVGEEAPDFTLPSTAGFLTLSEVWRDRKVVLAFYIEDNTPGRAQEVSSLKGEYDTVKDAGGEVVAVTADSLDSHRRFCQAIGGCPFPLACDTLITESLTSPAGLPPAWPPSWDTACWSCSPV